MALSPGSKGWITKYGDLLKKGDINACIEKPAEIETDHFQHLVFSKSGIVFGHVSEYLFAKNINDSKWTSEEKLQLLLFESHLFIFINNGGDPVKDFNKFLNKLIDFYGNHSSQSIMRLFTFFMKESKIEKLENIFAKRVDVKVNLLDNAIWVNYLSNAFVFLDVILFQEFIRTEQEIKVSDYEDFALNAMYALILSAHSDGVIEDKEKNIFNVFLASAHMDDERREIAIEKFKNGATFYDFSPNLVRIWMFRRFLLDIAALTIYATHLVSEDEKDFLSQLCDYLKIPEEELQETLVMIEIFVLNHNDQIIFLQDNNAYEKMFGNISRRWIRILGRNKDKLANELKESKELVFLITKSTTRELTKEEKEKVKTQFLDVVKSVPALAIFMLPGGVILLPLVLKIIPKLVPSAFRNNEIEP